MIDAMAGGTGVVSHAMFRYAEQADRAAACAEFVRSGLAERAAVLVAGTRALVEQLRPRLQEATAQVSMIELPGTGADPGRLLSVMRGFVNQHAGRPVRLVQEVGWLDRPAEELSEALGYETLLCQGLAGSAARVLCGYHEHMSASVLAAAEQAHQVPGPGALALTLSHPPRTAMTRRFRDDQVEVRRFAEDQGRLAGLTRDRLTDLMMIVGELAANTLRHTPGPGTLMTWTTADEFVCQVSDQGQISDPLAGTLSPDPADTGGRRGLWLVHQVGDLVQVRSGTHGTTVRVHLQLQNTERIAFKPG